MQNTIWKNNLVKHINMSKEDKEIKKIQKSCGWHLRGECMADSGPWGVYPCYICDYVLKELKKDGSIHKDRES